MRAMQLDHVGPIETHPLHLRDIEIPEPGNGQLLMKVAACGVCRSNLHTIEGDWVAGGVPGKSPIIPGHEIVGHVERIGPNVTGFAVGEYIGVQPLWSTDLSCTFCLTSREQLCRAKEIAGETVDGGYAEYMLATAAHTYKVPDVLSPAEAAPLFCPGITAYRSVQRAQLAPGQTVALFGMGGVGHMVVQFAKLAGADVVTVARGKRHRELAMELGAIRTVDASGPNLASELQSNGGIDAAIVFAPSDAMLQAAVDAVKPGGIIVNGAAHNVGNLVFADEKSLIGSVIGNARPDADRPRDRRRRQGQGPREELRARRSRTRPSPISRAANWTRAPCSSCVSAAACATACSEAERARPRRTLSAKPSTARPMPQFRQAFCTATNCASLAERAVARRPVVAFEAEVDAESERRDEIHERHERQDEGERCRAATAPWFINQNGQRKNAPQFHMPE